MQPNVIPVHTSFISEPGIKLQRGLSTGCKKWKNMLRVFPIYSSRSQHAGQAMRSHVQSNRTTTPSGTRVSFAGGSGRIRVQQPYHRAPLRPREYRRRRSQNTQGKNGTSRLSPMVMNEKPKLIFFYNNYAILQYVSTANHCTFGNDRKRHHRALLPSLAEHVKM